MSQKHTHPIHFIIDAILICTRHSSIFVFSLQEVDDQGLPVLLELRVSLPGSSGIRDVELDLEPR